MSFFFGGNSLGPRFDPFGNCNTSNPCIIAESASNFSFPSLSFLTIFPSKPKADQPHNWCIAREELMPNPRLFGRASKWAPRGGKTKTRQTGGVVLELSILAWAMCEESAKSATTSTSGIRCWSCTYYVGMQAVARGTGDQRSRPTGIRTTKSFNGLKLDYRRPVLRASGLIHIGAVEILPRLYDDRPSLTQPWPSNNNNSLILVLLI